MRGTARRLSAVALRVADLRPVVLVRVVDVPAVWGAPSALGGAPRRRVHGPTVGPLETENELSKSGRSIFPQHMEAWGY